MFKYDSFIVAIVHVYAYDLYICICMRKSEGGKERGERDKTLATRERTSTMIGRTED